MRRFLLPLFVGLAMLVGSLSAVPAMAKEPVY